IEEEEARLTARREEEKAKMIAREIKNIQDQITSLREIITAVKHNLRKQDLVSGALVDVKRQQLPDNPERNTIYAIVLGSEGFRSGKHNWEVEVGDHSHWYIGVAKESINRKEEAFATPVYRYWAINLRRGNYSAGDNSLMLKRRPQRTRVQLDYDKREVSFYNLKDMTHIHKYKDTFTERMYPYFSYGKAGDADHPDIHISLSPEVCFVNRIFSQ
uniref:B30.2/SPRY domain-containing protein n=1 Tax=Hucho hucho TaxID=62062 RepID=A0A4W5M417_9TELE